MKKVLKWIGAVLGILIVVLSVFLAYLTVNEYRPADRETLEVREDGSWVSLDQEFTVLTYNIGYGGLSQEEDFFMDGGKKVRADSEEVIQRNMEGIIQELQEHQANIYLFQEIDIDSKRSYHINQREYFEKQIGVEGIFAHNFNSKYVPYPIPTIGKVESGLLTVSDLGVESAERIALPVPFSWPVSTCNLKRCLLETRIPIEGTEQELVVFNLHLEAYDDGEGKLKQTQMLMGLLEEEYLKGNYVIAGGDFNQTFNSIEGYPIFNQDDWVPGVLEEESLPKGFSLAVNDNSATCRLLNGPYSGNYEESQVFVIDGYILSDNIEVREVEVIDTQFQYSDHQPVKLTFRFAE